MHGELKRQFLWQRQFLPEIINIVGTHLGPHLFKEAPPQQDMTENTDLMILQARDIRVACRLRTPGYFKDYPFDVTFRCWLASGNKTEIHKLMSGFGHAFFYGFIEGLPPKIVCWRLLSLQQLRKLFVTFDLSANWTAQDLADFAQKEYAIRSGIKDNRDEETAFLYMDVRRLEMLDILIATSSREGFYSQIEMKF